MTLTARRFALHSTSPDFLSFAHLRVAAEEGQHAEAIQEFVNQTCQAQHLLMAEDVTDKDPMFSPHFPKPDITFWPWGEVDIDSGWVQMLVAMCHFAGALDTAPSVELNLNMIHETGTITVVNATEARVEWYTVECRYIATLTEGIAAKSFWTPHHFFKARIKDRTTGQEWTQDFEAFYTIPLHLPILRHMMLTQRQVLAKVNHNQPTT